MKYLRILSEVAATPWAIEPAKGEAMLSVLRFAARGGKRTPEEIEAVVRAQDIHDDFSEESARRRNSDGTPTPGGIAVLSLKGVLSPRASGMEDVSTGFGTSCERFGRNLRAVLSDTNISAVVIDVNSPGGNVHGVTELAQQMRAARGAKPIIACVSPVCASAAYWIAAQADEIVVTESGEVGSIGVVAYHEDISRLLDAEGVTPTIIRSSPEKMETHPSFPLTDAAKAHLQGEIDRYYEMFLADVAAGRGVTVDQVKADYGRGRMVGARDAVRLGMADRIGTLDDELARLTQRASKAMAGRGRRALALS
jgi:signal peptide peptidase SppA